MLIIMDKLNKTIATLSPHLIIKVESRTERSRGRASMDSGPNPVQCYVCGSPVVGGWTEQEFHCVPILLKSHFVSPLSEGVGTVGTDRTDCSQKEPRNVYHHHYGARYIIPLSGKGV